MAGTGAELPFSVLTAVDATILSASFPVRDNYSVSVIFNALLRGVRAITEVSTFPFLRMNKNFEVLVLML